MSRGTPRWRAAAVLAGAAAVALGGRGGGPPLPWPSPPGALAAQEAAAPPGTACPAAAVVTGGAELPFAAVRYLADDALEGRLAGSPGERCAGAYIAREFARIGLEPAGEDGGWFQAVSLESQANPHSPGGVGRNVLGLLRGGDPELSGEAVIVGAHYDHLGRGGFGSLAPELEGEIHNGADDNASGVAAMMRAAELLARGERPARSVLFVAFTGEELGLLGSSRYVRDPAVPLERTVAMVNLDMVGRLDSRPLIVNGTATAEEWAGILEAAGEKVGIELAHGESGYGPSDHTSFYAREIPVLHLFTNVHSDYHRPTDDWERIDLPGLERVAELVAAVVSEVADRPGRLAVRPPEGPPPAPSREGYGAYLGTIPDFAPVERGVRITGVTAGSPAAEAGLRAGDVIVGLGELEVEDLYDMTEALRAHRPGDAVEVRVLRDGEELKFRAVLGSRSRRPR